MTLSNHDMINKWHCFVFALLLSLILSIGRKIYAIWFTLIKIWVKILQQHISPFIGALSGLLLLEGYTLCKAIWFILKKYRNDPMVYDLDQLHEKYYHYRPVLLLHGAVGSWAYLGDLARALKNAGVPVFVIDLGLGLPTEEMRKRIFNKIEEIRKLYNDSCDKIYDESYDVQIYYNPSFSHEKGESSTVKLLTVDHNSENKTTAVNSARSNTIPMVDIIAHSSGGYLALYSAFTETCSSIDEEHNFKFRSVPQPNPYIGKLITIALPTNQKEMNWMRDINKLNELFNINAKFDVLMAYKKCALESELPSNIEYIDAGHFGIVFHRLTHYQILRFLRQ